MTFYAIASILDVAAYQNVEGIWKMLETECRLTAIQRTPYPHLSWQVAEEYRTRELLTRLKNIAGSTQPFNIRCTGLGIFSGPAPVVYIQIVKDLPLLQFHDRLWQATFPLAENLNLRYLPNQWMPHITLAYHDITPKNLDCVFQKLVFQAYDWEIRLDNLALVCQEGHKIGQLKHKIMFPREG